MLQNNQVTSPEEFQRHVEEKRYSYFSFPVLEITIQYRKPDLLKLAFNKSLPAVMADTVIKAYKAHLSGAAAAYEKEMKEKTIEASDELVSDLREKGYQLLKELCSSHKILDVPQSDFANNVISWLDIPEEDAIAFLLHLLNSAQVSTTTEGGEMSAKDIQDFPDGKRVPKRHIARKNG